VRLAGGPPSLGRNPSFMIADPDGNVPYDANAGHLGRQLHVTPGLDFYITTALCVRRVRRSTALGPFPNGGSTITDDVSGHGQVAAAVMAFGAAGTVDPPAVYRVCVGMADRHLDRGALELQVQRQGFGGGQRGARQRPDPCANGGRVRAGRRSGSRRWVPLQLVSLPGRPREGHSAAVRIRKGA
jgi:hypothetical protein